MAGHELLDSAQVGHAERASAPQKFETIVALLNDKHPPSRDVDAVIWQSNKQAQLQSLASGILDAPVWGRLRVKRRITQLNGNDRSEEIPLLGELGVLFSNVSTDKKRSRRARKLIKG